jgi:UDP-N-acetylglucosamine--N-acetylmuramyl-(pentapeptide) pyrophosphoryl-undecaprenol N-acetylglucosamine transferase
MQSDRREPAARKRKPAEKGTTFLMAGGGTGGHVIPAIAVARELRQRGHKVFFVGTERGIEAKLVPAAGFELKKIEIGGLNRVGLLQKLSTLAKLPIATLACRKLVRQVSAVFSMGGYAAGPPVLAALLGRIPVVVMEPNAMPGFTNRVIGRFVCRALISFPQTADYFPKARTETTGLPVREEFFHIAPKPQGDVLNILITGGSQGSQTLNRAARESWPLLRNAGLQVRIVHQTGQREYDELRAAFKGSGIAGQIVPFITNMPEAFVTADLVVCRSGAGAVSELAAAGKPSILVPFPFAADDHQARNAEAMERGGAARLIRDAELNGESLVHAISDLRGRPGELERMGEAARRFARPGAAQRAAEILEEAVGGARQ